MDKQIIRYTTSLNYILLLYLFIGLSSCSQKEANTKTETSYHVAAYIWPSCHHDERFGDMLWPEGEGEWEIIKKGTPRFDGHYQPKLPLWGYEKDDDPEVMEKWIETATSHGVNVFIFDWYWFDEGPFLEGSLNNGFLKAKNNEKMKYYIMWANHDVRRNYWNVHQFANDTSIMWEGAVDLKNFKQIVARVIPKYFKTSNYFTINGEPVFHIFELNNFVKGMGGLENTRKAFQYFREEAQKAGLPGVHIQVRAHGGMNPAILSNRFCEGKDVNEVINYIGISSVTKYGWGIDEDYLKLGEETLRKRQILDSVLNVPYFPNVSIGWDDTPRFPAKTKKDVMHRNVSPESFGAFLHKAKEYCDEHPDQPNLITVFSWNEWVEGSYLLPDLKYGFSYLEEVKKTISTK